MNKKLALAAAVAVVAAIYLYRRRNRPSGFKRVAADIGSGLQPFYTPSWLQVNQSDAQLVAACAADAGCAAVMTKTGGGQRYVYAVPASAGKTIRGKANAGAAGDPISYIRPGLAFTAS